MAKALDNLGAAWGRTSIVQRVLLVGLLLGCIGAGAVLVMWMRQPHMAMLYSRLAPEEAAKIVEKVRDSGSPYELKDGGTTVYVPEDKVYSLRLTMASQGLPVGESAGYRILDEEKIGASPFTQRVNYIRALEGELAKSVQLIEGVAGARIHIVKPESSLFAGHDKEASATAVVRMKSGRQLSQPNVAAVVHLLAGSVEGLTPGRVVVVDSAGKLLSGEEESPEMKTASNFLDYKTRVEQYLGRKAQEMLTTVLGPGRATVSVDATIDSSSVNHIEEKYDPNNKVVGSEETKTNKTNPSTGGSGAATGGGSNEETSKTEYMVSKTTETKIDLPGNIKSMTVAAFVDLTPPAAKEGETPAPAMQLKDVEDILRGALGLRPADTLKVVNTPFNKPPEPAAVVEESGFMNKTFLLDMAERLSLVVLVIGALAAMKMFRGKKKGAGTVSVSAVGGQAALEGVSGGSTNLLTGSPAEMDPRLLRAHITKALQENPDEVKRLFLSWVENEKVEQ